MQWQGALVANEVIDALPATRFVVRENAEENALAVQFNNAGQVRLQLRSLSCPIDTIEYLPARYS